jgi:WD40 repeat protein
LRCRLPDCVPAPAARHRTWVKALAFSPDGKRLISGSADRELRLVDEPGERVLAGATTMTTELVFTPDGTRIVGGARDGGVRVWTVADGSTRLLGAHGSPVSALAVSADGRLAASGAHDRTVRIWDLVTGEGQVLRGHRGAVTRVVWIDLRRVLSTEADGTIRLWTADPSAGIPRDPQSLRAWLELTTTARVSGDAIQSPRN